MSRVASVETFIVTVPRDTPYLGPLAPDERVNARGYVVRKGNGTIYPVVDRSIVVRITTEDGAIGWGETYGICAPRATCEIINDLLAPVTIGANPADVEAIWDELYGLMRVRGCSGGFHVDAIAAIDIALWDLRGKQRGVPIRDLLGTDGECHRARLSVGPARRDARRARRARRRQICSGASRVQVRRGRESRGHRGGNGRAAQSTRTRCADHGRSALEVHRDRGAGADRRARAVSGRFFVEAPVKPEDHAGLARVARESPVPIAAGEEWYTAYEVAQSSRRRADRRPAARDGSHRHHAVPPHRCAGSGAGGRDRSARDDRHRTVSCGQPAGLGNIAAPVEA